MFDLSLYILGGVFVLFILASLSRWAIAVRGLTQEATEEYQTRCTEKPASVRSVSQEEFVHLFVTSFQPRWTLYAAAAAAAAIVVSPAALLAVPALYDVIWRANGAPDWGGRTGYVFMFSLFFGVVFIWAALAAFIARLHHLRAPEPFNHALARARGEPIEDTGWRPRPKWARKIKIDTADTETDS